MRRHFKWILALGILVIVVLTIVSEEVGNSDDVNGGLPEDDKETQEPTPDQGTPDRKPVSVSVGDVSEPPEVSRLHVSVRDAESRSAIGDSLLRCNPKEGTILELGGGVFEVICHVDDVRLEAAAPDYYSAQLNYVSAEAPNEEIYLKAKCMVSGRTTCPQVHAIAHFVVAFPLGLDPSLLPQDAPHMERKGPVNADGSFSIQDLVFGSSYKLYFSWESQKESLERQPFEVVQRQQDLGFIISSPRSLLTVFVTSDSGTAVVGTAVSVALWPDESTDGLATETHKVQTDSNGQVSVWVLCGQVCRAMVDSEGIFGFFGPATITQEPLSAHITLHHGSSLSGVVSDQRGERLAGVSVSASMLRPDGMGHMSRSATSDESGIFRIEDVPPIDAYLGVRAELPPEYIATGGRMRVRAPEKDIRVEVECLGSIRIRCVDEETGEALDTIGITALPKVQGFMRDWNAEGDGWFSITNLSTKATSISIWTSHHMPRELILADLVEGSLIQLRLRDTFAVTLESPFPASFTNVEYTCTRDGELVGSFDFSVRPNQKTSSCMWYGPGEYVFVWRDRTGAKTPGSWNSSAPTAEATVTLSKLPVEEVHVRFQRTK